MGGGSLRLVRRENKRCDGKAESEHHGDVSDVQNLTTKFGTNKIGTEEKLWGTT